MKTIFKLIKMLEMLVRNYVAGNVRQTVAIYVKLIAETTSIEETFK